MKDMYKVPKAKPGNVFSIKATFQSSSSWSSLPFCFPCVNKEDKSHKKLKQCITDTTNQHDTWLQPAVSSSQIEENSNNSTCSVIWTLRIPLTPFPVSKLLRNTDIWAIKNTPREHWLPNTTAIVVFLAVNWSLPLHLHCWFVTASLTSADNRPFTSLCIVSHSFRIILRKASNCISNYKKEK